MPVRVALLRETRADAGIYQPLIDAMQQDARFTLRVTHKPSVVPTADDWLIVLGDRRAMLEATIDAAYLGVPVAHIQGGDRSGTIDEPCRHAITRFANLHFPCTKASADRLVRMGEEPWRIKVVGPLGIYAMQNQPLLSKGGICAKLGLLAEREIVLVIQHPVSTQVAYAGAQMHQTLEAVKSWQTVVIYPNSDPGSEAMRHQIGVCDWIHKITNLPYLDFISLLQAAAVVVGNSSTGLYEAPLFGVPAVNIGNRQQDRERGRNVIQCNHNVTEIRNCIEQALRVKRLGDGNPFATLVDGPKIIMDTLASTTVNERLLQKRLPW